METMSSQFCNVQETILFGVREKMCEIPTFVDLQGFIVNEKFIVKEVAILKHGVVLTHYIYQPPIPWNQLTDSEKRSVNWLVRNHHRLQWNVGEIDYQQARCLIRRAIRGDDGTHVNNYENIYVKGLQKKTWLLELLGNVASQYNVKAIEDDFGEIGRLEDLNNTWALRCMYHTTRCAQENVIKVYTWWRNRQIDTL